MQKKSKMTDLELLAEMPVRVDYLFLFDQLSSFKSPKKKIFDLKKKGYLRSLKRGQYFNLKSKYIKTTSYELVANSLYFPSYVSMEWALQFYGLLSDRVTVVTSVTTMRSKDFKTPYALFSYKHITKKRYPVGYVSMVHNDNDIFLIARPEKALIDYINIRAKDLTIKTHEDIREFLENDLRLDLIQFLKHVEVGDLKQLLPFYHRNSKEYRLLRWLIQQKEF